MGKIGLTNQIKENLSSQTNLDHRCRDNPNLSSQDKVSSNSLNIVDFNHNKIKIGLRIQTRIDQVFSNNQDKTGLNSLTKVDLSSLTKIDLVSNSNLVNLSSNNKLDQVVVNPSLNKFNPKICNNIDQQVIIYHKKGQQIHNKRQASNCRRSRMEIYSKAKSNSKVLLIHKYNRIKLYNCHKSLKNNITKITLIQMVLKITE